MGEFVSVCEPFLIIKYHKNLKNLIQGREPNSEYEIITLNNMRADYRGIKPVIIPDEYAKSLIDTLPNKATLSEEGHVYDFNGFKAAFQKKKSEYLMSQKKYRHDRKKNALEERI